MIILLVKQALLDYGKNLYQISHIVISIIFLEKAMRQIIYLMEQKNINILMPYFIKKDKDFNVPIKSIPRNFHSDIVFAGHYEDDFRIEYLEDLILKGYNVKVFGGGWK